ncbi:hypothetical protein JTB14_019606 [Gonioctena quinquepunctata]|nr:hypothetical protein JTB14_019606 [Gonioctena quinquepunctata]
MATAEDVVMRRLELFDRKERYNLHASAASGKVHATRLPGLENGASDSKRASDLHLPLSITKSRGVRHLNLSGGLWSEGEVSGMLIYVPWILKDALLVERSYPIIDLAKCEVSSPQVVSYYWSRD